MTEAWQKREYEQQQLLEGLMHQAFETSEKFENADRFHLLAAQELSEYHLINQGGTPHPSDNSDTERSRVKVWIDKVCEQLWRFSRTGEEFKMLLAKFTEKMFERGLAYAHQEYLRQKVREPEKLYEGHGSMDEVPS